MSEVDELKARLAEVVGERDLLRSELDGYLRVGAPNLMTQHGKALRERDEARREAKHGREVGYSIGRRVNRPATKAARMPRTAA